MQINAVKLLNLWVQPDTASGKDNLKSGSSKQDIKGGQQILRASFFKIIVVTPKIPY